MPTDIVVIDRARINQINAEHKACEANYHTAVEHAFKCGELLTAAKSELKHGDWLPWLEKNFDGEERTARTYMQLHREFSNRQRVADLKLDQLPSSIRAGLKEISKPKPRAQARQAYGAIAEGFVDDDEPTTGISPAKLEQAHDRLKAENPPVSVWTEQHERRRAQILEQLEDAKASLLEVSTDGLQAVAIADLLRSAEIRCRQAQAKISDLAFSFE